MSAEYKAQLPSQDPPQYAAHSPASADIQRDTSNQYHQAHYNEAPPQGQYPQHPQPTYGQPHQHQYPQQGAGGQEFRTAVPLASLQSSSAPVQCPTCGQRAMTRTNFTSGNTTHGWAAGICLLTCCGCIPYLISGLKDVEHRCGNCGAHLATWHRSGRTEVRVYP